MTHGYHDPLPDPEEVLAAAMAGFHPGNRYRTSAPIGAHIVNWRTLTDHDARKAWDELRAWVEWFTVRYRISETVIPPCWYKHGHLVEELSALHTAHTAAFDPSDAGLGPIGWHERLSLALPRLTRAYSGGCARGHDPLTPRTWTTTVDEQEWDAWTRKAHAHRDTHPGDSPTERKQR